MDKNKLFVGSLPWSVDSTALQDLFSQFGEISEAIVITDRETGRSKGFGFVTFVNEQSAKDALKLDGTELEGRTIVVNMAKPREERSGGGGGGFRRENRRRF